VTTLVVKREIGCTPAKEDMPLNQNLGAGISFKSKFTVQ
jgi:hypothetical protein